MIEDAELRQILSETAARASLPSEMTPRMRRKVALRRARTLGVSFLMTVGIVTGSLQGIRAVTQNEAAPVQPVNRPAPGAVRENGEVLDFTGGRTDASFDEPGDLVAVNPDTGEERVLVENLDNLYSARWSTDGRWVAYETQATEGREVWLVTASDEPRRVATGVSILAWSSTGAELATIRLKSPLRPWIIAGSTLSTIDPVTGDTTDAGSIPEGIGNVTSPPQWSPDGTKFAFGTRGGEIYSIDARDGARALLARLPGEDLDSVDQIVWSPDGAHIAVVNDGNPGGVYVMGADGSNVRVLLDGWTGTGIAWSPDGTNLAFRDASGVVWIASIDGSAPVEIGPLSTSCDDVLVCHEELAWSPDGSRIALRIVGGDRSVGASAIVADGRGEPELIDELTIRSWVGGWYSCGCGGWNS